MTTSPPDSSREFFSACTKGYIEAYCPRKVRIDRGLLPRRGESIWIGDI